MGNAAKVKNQGTVLSVASECVPLVKTGGLADVVGALPDGLALTGWHLKTLLPAYPGLAERIKKPKVVWSSKNLFGGCAQVISGKTANSDGALDMLLLQAPHLYDRGGSIYLNTKGNDWPDNAQRFAALSWAAAEISRKGLSDGWRPNILHAHDWQAGLAPAYLAYGGAKDVASLITIHNIAFQGLAPATLLKTLKLPRKHFVQDGFEYWGKISSLKAGLMTADAITTVSPTYAQELLEPEFGMGLEGVIRLKRDRLSGILNGVDLKTWNPRTDAHIAHAYGPRDLAAKSKNTRALEKEFGLIKGQGPLFAVISRLTHQKGLDLVLDTLPALLARGGRLIVLGSGDAGMEKAFAKAAKDHPGLVAVTIGYDEAQSHRIYAGADVMMVPSRFEPCGLTQLYALRYGTLPLVSRTGGLADTVIDANNAAVQTAVATGVQVAPNRSDSLEQGIRRMCDLFAKQELWVKLQKRAMAQPLGWEQSAQAYSELYQSLKK
ncbi:MAG: glycogen synthase GlgA [Rhodospirillales bacterium]|nr:glycogen synthase GlgA [Rhodospirillales bacterium]